MKRSIDILNPWVMATGLLLTFLGIYVLHYLSVVLSGDEMDARQIWIYMMGAALVYAIFSTINLLYARKTGQYYYKSLMAFGVLLVIGGILATWISGRSILDLESYRKVFVFVIFTFLALLSIASVIKRLENWSRLKDDQFLHRGEEEQE